MAGSFPGVGGQVAMREGIAARAHLVSEIN
jgi:hypothetical protein